MTKKELLETYRTTVQELEELEVQLNRTGTDGRPAGHHFTTFGGTLPGTNHPAAAAMQLADGLEAMADRKRQELTILSGPMYELLSSIADFRTFAVIQRYYLMAETDSSISDSLRISRQRVNQIRLSYLDTSA